MDENSQVSEKLEVTEKEMESVVDAIENQQAPAEEVVSGKPSESKQALDSIDSATMMFGLYYPRYKAIVEGLSNKSLKRLNLALVGHVLEGAKLNFKLAAEKEAFEIAQNLKQSEMTLMLYTAMQQEEKRLALIEENKAKGIVSSEEQFVDQMLNNPGENNG